MVSPSHEVLRRAEQPDRDQYRMGKAFCDTVAGQTDEVTLARMWDSAEAMPSLPEIEEPRLWLARSA